ncbi:transglutaminase-like domain-containing protein [Micromonosporaceae bacterium Da 78-11]
MNDSQVGSSLGFDVTEPAELVLQIAAVRPVTESLRVTSDGEPVEVLELPGRQHYVKAPKGRLDVVYQATVAPQPGPPAVTGFERIVALRPSRYCPSDRLAGFAATQFGRAAEPADTVRAITDWVFEHLAYVGGSSGPTTDAIDTLLAGAGVCRDYAHLVATLCRSLNIPARVAAVYAPGLFPMDFHLVVETALDGQWRVWDATRLAPRPTLIRIATGRDAADTALATTISGMLTMPDTEIFAVAGGDLPLDDHVSLVSLP